MIGLFRTLTGWLAVLGVVAAGLGLAAAIAARVAPDHAWMLAFVAVAFVLSDRRVWRRS